jgi:hypothetical protein
MWVAPRLLSVVLGEDRRKFPVARTDECQHICVHLDPSPSDLKSEI